LRKSSPLSASTIPRATWSPRVMPPKMLMNIALTFGSPTTSAFGLPSTNIATVLASIHT